MKKTLAILLSLALVVCMIPATASVAFGAEGLVVTLTAYEVEYNGTRQAPRIASAIVATNKITLIIIAIIKYTPFNSYIKLSSYLSPMESHPYLISLYSA